jgi:tRNA-specific 2-thiouridylase
MLAGGPGEVIGVTLCLRPAESTAPSRSCCGVDDLAMARAVADRLGIRHYVIDGRAEFEKLVLRPAWEEYARGRTPNPCVACNQRLKFGLLAAHAASIGAAAVATGHYARLETDGRGEPVLRRGADRRKDQSYFLFALGREQLRLARTPLGGMTKREVRERAAALGLPNADRPGSRDACLAAADGSFAEALRLLGGGEARPGRVVDSRGNVLGFHEGIHRFTVGQRHGLRLARGRPTYVLAIDASSGDVTVGSWEELLATGLVASGVRWLIDPPVAPVRLRVQTRYRQPEVDALVSPRGDDAVDVRLDRPAAGIAPGQAAVFYDGDRVVGGGWIDELIRGPRSGA